jgi:GNAT superfamily N-acetyltransferase
MPREELQREMQGITFFGWDEGDGLVGVMGYQPVEDVTLIRHAYTVTSRQGEGIGGTLLEHLKGLPAGRQGMTSTQRLLVGTWAAAIWAIRFYERHGFRLLADGQELLERYWEIPTRQRETSVVLGLEV